MAVIPEHYTLPGRRLHLVFPILLAIIGAVIDKGLRKIRVC